MFIIHKFLNLQVKESYVIFYMVEWSDLIPIYIVGSGPNILRFEFHFIL